MDADAARRSDLQGCPLGMGLRQMANTIVLFNVHHKTANCTVLHTARRVLIFLNRFTFLGILPLENGTAIA
jgi:hypothetical protein